MPESQLQAREDTPEQVADNEAAAPQTPRSRRIWFVRAAIATNLKDCAPFASQHREGLSQGDLQKWSTLVDEGSRLESAEDYAQALPLYRQALAIDDQYAELEFRIARSLEKTGDTQQAAEHFARARDLDTLRFRADSHINQINRSAAAAGAEVIDAEAIFSRSNPTGTIGSELVYEHVHLTPAGNYLLARGMFRKIATQISGQPITNDEIPTEAQCDRLLALTGHDRYRMSNEMLQRLERPPFTNQLNHAEQQLRLSIDTQAPVESPDDTVAEYRIAI
jgi:tetratricopeptide (TPR) repeat protein